MVMTRTRSDHASAGRPRDHNNAYTNRAGLVGLTRAPRTSFKTKTRVLFVTVKDVKAKRVVGATQALTGHSAHRASRHAPCPPTLISEPRHNNYPFLA